VSTVPDRAQPFGRYLEEFQEGDVYRHFPGKTITESDNNLFCLLTMNHHPVHLDVAYASETQHAQRLVVGTLVFSLAVGLTVRDISGRAIANLGYEEVTHLGPVFLGDTIYATSRVLSVTPSQSKSDRGVVSVETTVENERGQLVLRFRRKVLIPRRPPLAATSQEGTR
jgi:acyl dehydratase